jgi:lantibiotic modifying enzyme
MNEEDDQLAPLYGTGFATGTAGLGYIFTLLQQSGLVEIDLQEQLQEMDAGIAAAALQQIEQQEHNDYLHGAMGAVHYFLMRADEPQIRQYLEQLAAALCRKAVHSPEGSWLRNYIMDESEKARIDLSISHGNAGFLLLLLNMMEAGIMTEELKELINNGIRFIISRRRIMNEKDEAYSLFPFSVSSTAFTDIYVAPRLAWCYGDLNIAWLLYRAAAVLQEPAWKVLAEEITLDTISRKDAASTMATDAHFCHGASGLAHFYKVIYAHTGDERHHQAASYWIGETLRYLNTELKNDYYKNKETDLLNGLPGISLVLLSFTAEKELAWGRAFLL